MTLVAEAGTITTTPQQLALLLRISVFLCLEINELKSNQEDQLAAKGKLEKQLKAEKVLKQQAVIQQAEVMNRKDMNRDNKKNKVAA